MNTLINYTVDLHQRNMNNNNSMIDIDVFILTWRLLLQLLNFDSKQIFGLLNL